MGIYDDWYKKYVNKALFSELCGLFTNTIEELYGHLRPIVLENSFEIDLESYFGELVDWRFKGGKSNEYY